MNRKGFTLIELLVVIVVLAVIAAFLFPKFQHSAQVQAEKRLHDNLKQTRLAVNLWYDDTGTYPLSLENLVASSAPDTARDTTGKVVKLSHEDWHGPYLAEECADPITEKPFHYITTGRDTGKVKCISTARALNGTHYNTW